MIFDLNVPPLSVEDTDLEYSASSHRWLLSLVKTKLIYPYLGEEDAKSKREEVSDSVYYEAQYVLSNTMNWPFSEWAINCTDEGRNALKACLLAQAKADATSGLGSLAFQSPIENGQVIGKKALEDNSVNFRVDGILRSLVLFDGSQAYPLFRMFDFGIRMSTSRYEDLGY